MDKRYKPGEFGKLINRTVGTLRLWDRSGKLKAKRTASGHRYYTDDDLLKALNLERKKVKTYNLIYGRVSSPKQKLDLERQISTLESFALAKGLVIDLVIKDIGGGLNYTRPKFLDLMNRVEKRELKTLVIAHKDRLCRFGFDYFEHFFKNHGCELIVANSQSLSPQQELLEDLLAVVHTFSCRLYGLRKYQKKIIKFISEKEINPQ